MRADLPAHEAALQVAIAGSYRRRKEIVRDLDFLVATNEPEAVTEFFVGPSAGRERDRARPDQIERSPEFGIAVRSARGEDGGISLRAQLLHRDKEHNIVMRSRALHGLDAERIPARSGSTLSEGEKEKSPSGIPRSRRSRPYRAVDLDYIPPELRENCGEFEAAEQHSLPD